MTKSKIAGVLILTTILIAIFIAVGLTKGFLYAVLSYSIAVAGAFLIFYATYLITK